MNVTKQTQTVEPAYPNRRQFAKCQLLLGVAAIGLGAAMGRAGDTPRLAGDIKAEPGKTVITPVRPVLMGVMRADPAGCASKTNAPVATNQVPAAVVKTNVCTRLGGEMPADVKK
jgi:hypothetical protein